MKSKSLKVNITNIPRERWSDVQSKIFRMLLVEEGYEVETIDIKDGLTGEFIGVEYEVKERS